MQKRYLQTGESPEEGNCDLGRAGVIDMQGKAEETGFDQPEGWGDICLQHPRASKRVTENAETNILHGCTVKGKKPQSQFAEGKLQLDLRKKKCTMRMIKPWNRLSENRGKLSLEIFQNLVGQVPGRHDPVWD